MTADLNINGSGKFDVKCNVSFFRHVTETLARYAEFDLRLTASGDNDHHVIEDTAITLRQAFKKAVGDGPVKCTTSCLPMNDALVMVSLNIVDRPYYDADSPDPLYEYFFRNFAVSADITLHVVEIRGFDTHYIIEACSRPLADAFTMRPSPERRSSAPKMR